MNAKEQLRDRLGRTEFVRFLFGFLLLGPVVLLILAVLFLPASPEAGFAGLNLLFGTAAWWPILLVPLVGFCIASGRVSALKRELEDLPDDEETHNAA